MPSLDSYLDFTVTLDFQQGRIVIIDTSQYPNLVPQGIKGIVTTIQPDQIIRAGDFLSPDVIFSNGQLTQGLVELRRQSNGLPQQGQYTIIYEVDCDGYTPTAKSKTFILAYLGITPVITEMFDVFTPVLSVQDNTDYSYGGFNLADVERAWLVVMPNVGQIGGSSPSLNLIYNSAYYDDDYQITLGVKTTYQHQVYSFLTVVDYHITVLNTSATTPPSYTVLEACLKQIKSNLDSAQTQFTEPLRDDFAYASAVLREIKHRICTRDTMNLYPQIQDFLNVYHNHVTVLIPHTYQPIPTYNYNDVNCGGNSSSTTDARITTTDINNWNAAYLAIPPDDIEVRVGMDAGAPAIGTSTWQNAAFAGRRVRFYLGRAKQSTITAQADITYSKPKASDTLTINGYTWGQGDLLQIEFY